MPGLLTISSRQLKLKLRVSPWNKQENKEIDR
ncbi:hypothetical protein C5167_034645 [Papaver somniferum]|uniref:Uncharacterized protein n=1 Tax=Papaver somniferum TaxID=3469 RepID=A0A4Y7KF68_PAPSO|nr:hypothetical protein C5167_034645 [Papaver somniferum]